MTPFHVVIPARYASSRLPGKPMLEIAGKPMVLHVVDKALASGALSVWVATDDSRIHDAVTAAGHNSLMTSSEHASGTDRLAEVAVQLKLADDAIVVNVQGDEPLMPPALIRETAEALARRSQAHISTACHRIHDRASHFNPNIVKVVLDRDGLAQYFSRAPIPYARDAYMADGAMPVDLPVYRHIGIYAYRASFLKVYSDLTPAPTETFEALEQLRAMWHGYRIAVTITENAPAAGVDTSDDLQRVRHLLHS